MDACHWVTFYYICFLFFCPLQKGLYYYVKLCLWKHKTASLLCSPSPGKHDSTSRFPHRGWKTVSIEAMCAATSCSERISWPNHNMFQLFAKWGGKHAAFVVFWTYLNILRIRWRLWYERKIKNNLRGQWETGDPIGVSSWDGFRLLPLGPDWRRLYEQDGFFQALETHLNEYCDFL